MPRPRKAAVKVRRRWNLRPATRVIEDRTKRPHRKRKHKGRENGEG